MRKKYQTERGCVNTVGGSEDIYFFKGCVRLVYLLKLFLTERCRRLSRYCVESQGQVTFCSCELYGAFFPLLSSKQTVGPFSPFLKMNKHEQMPVRLHCLLCWRRRMWTLEGVWLDSGKTALIRALGGIWYHVHLRVTEKIARVWGQVNLVHLHWRQWEGETVCSGTSLQLLMEKHLFWTSRPDTVGGSWDSND